MLWWTLRQLKSKNFHTREAAARRLGDSKSPAAVEPLVDVWRAESSVNTGVAALESLVRLGPIALEAIIGALQDEQWWIRQEAARALGKIGDARAAASLAAALADRDPQVRREAGDALVRIGQPAVQPVIAALGIEDTAYRLFAAEVLGRLKSCEGVEPLIRLLKDTSPGPRGAAASGLGEIGDSAAIEPLRRALSDEEPDVRAAAATSLGAIADQSCVEPVVVTLRKDKAAKVRQAAALALHRIRGEGALESLVAAFDDADAQVRAAAHKLGPFHGGAVLAAAFERGDWRLRKEVVRELGADSPETPEAQAMLAVLRRDWDTATRLGPAGVPGILGALLDEDALVRINAKKAIERIGAPAVEPLAASLLGQTGALREFVIELLDGLGWSPSCVAERVWRAIARRQREEVVAEGADVVGTLTAALAEGDADAYERINGWLNSIDAAWPKSAAAQEAVPALIEALGTWDDDARFRAVEALRKIGAPAVKSLVESLEHPAWRVRAGAAEALERRADKSAVEPLVELLKNDCWPARMAALKALIRMGDKCPGEALAGAAEDEDPEIRAAAAQAQSRRRDSGRLGQLVATLKSADSAQRAGAVEALGSEPPAVARSAIAALAQSRDPHKAELLLAALRDPQCCWGDIAARALAELGDTRAVEPLLAALRDPGCVWRDAAARALGSLHARAAIEPLAFSLAGPDPALSTVALNALASIEPKWAGSEEARGCLPALLELLKSDPRAALNTLTILDEGWARSEAAQGCVPALLGLLQSDPSAVQALGMIGDERAVRPLLERQLSERYGVGTFRALELVLTRSAARVAVEDLFAIAALRGTWGVGDSRTDVDGCTRSEDTWEDGSALRQLARQELIRRGLEA